MQRAGIVLLGLLLLIGGAVVVAPSVARGQEAPPAAPQAQPPGAADAAAAEVPAEAPPKLDKWNDAHSIWRSSRPFASWVKLLALWFLFLIWVRSADWINRDSQVFNLGYGLWNPAIFFPFFIFLILSAWVAPGLIPYWIVYAILWVIYLSVFIPYTVIRNKSVQLHQRVFTPDWFRYEVGTILNKVGIKVETERKADYEKGANVDLMAIDAKDERTNQANLLTARQSPGYLLVKELVAEMSDRRADRTLLDYTQQTVMSRQLIDGVWHNGRTTDRESGDVMLAVMKVLSNLDMAERRKKQAGKFGAKYNDHKYVGQMVSQGVKTGERVMLDLLGGQRASYRTYESLGMRKKMAESWGELMALDRGVLIIAGLPEGGITTLTDVSLTETDRLLRDFVAIEEVHHRERELENIDVTTYDAAKGESPSTLLPTLVRKYPNVYVVRDFVDTEAAKILLKEVEDDHLVITNVQAKEATEALLRMLQKQVPQREFAKNVTAVICTRLIRKLCETCKIGYQPTPDLAKKLGLPEGKVETLFRTPKPEEVEKPCKTCGGIGYFGRTGIFELLTVSDAIREILIKQPNLDLLRKAARAAGMRTFQEEGVLLIAKGVTSLAELQRVLKQ